MRFRDCLGDCVRARNDDLVPSLACLAVPFASRKRRAKPAAPQIQQRTIMPTHSNSLQDHTSENARELIHQRYITTAHFSETFRISLVREKDSKQQSMDAQPAWFVNHLLHVAQTYRSNSKNNPRATQINHSLPPTLHRTTPPILGRPHLPIFHHQRTSRISLLPHILQKNLTLLIP